MKDNTYSSVTSIQLKGNGATGKKRPQDQTDEEWLSDLNSADSYRVAKWGESESRRRPDKQGNFIHLSGNTEESVPELKPCSTTTQLYFRYIDHRTTRQGSVAMDFESLDGEITATAFLNVYIKSNRGTKYPTGKRGQFIPPEGGKFRKLWIKAVDQAPPRWSRVHKSMRSHFRELVFTGEITKEIDSKGHHYYKLRNVQPRK